jgi:glycogen debranching enzyme
MLERSRSLEANASRVMERLRTTLEVNHERFVGYNAGSIEGSVRFGLFPRDLFSTALLLQSHDLLRETIRFAVHTIGRSCDPVTGEEPGRVLHEWNRVEREGLLSHYNACETSQLLLTAAREFLRAGTEEDVALLSDVAGGLAAAGRYVLSHIREGLFLEDPRRSGARRYFAHATYWKDSHLPGRREIAYPVCFSLVQAQTVCALRALADLTSRLRLPWGPDELRAVAARLVGQLWDRLWDETSRYPLIAVDGETSVAGVSSDALHMLAYLEPADVPAPCLEGIRTGSVRLETEFGFRTYAPGQPDYAPDAYHLGSIWPYEQAFIARGARRFGLGGAFDVSARILPALERLGFPELIILDDGRLEGGGCDLQLWTCATPHAFAELLSQASDGVRQEPDR